MQKRKKRSFLKGIVIAVLIFFLVSVSSILIYSATIDYSVDEALFIAAKNSNVTKLYYDKENGAKTLEGYVPELYEELYGITRKEWCDYEEISEARKRLLSYAEENNLTLTGVFRNIYLEGPPQHKDKSKFITQIIAIIE